MGRILVWDFIDFWNYCGVALKYQIYGVLTYRDKWTIDFIGF